MPTNDEAAIRAVVEARNAAVHAGEPERAMEALSEDVVTYDLQPPLQFTGAAARDAEGMAQWLSTWDGPVSIEMPNPAVEIDGNLAVVHGLSRMQGTKRDDGPVDLWYRTTMCLKRAGGSWSIIHEHHSVPMAMDGSGLAAVNLKP